MDSVSHLVAGGLTPLAFLRMPRRWGIVLFGILAGELPDYDVFFEMGTLKGLLTLHRGISHALVWQPLLALALSLVFYLYFSATEKKGTVRFLPLFVSALLGLYIHVFLDCMTTFGTQILLPFSHMRVWLPSMFIVDFLLLIPATICFIAALVCYRKQAPSNHLCVGSVANCAGSKGLFGFFIPPVRSVLYARLGLCWVVLYPLLALSTNYALTVYVAQQAKKQGYADAILLTEAFSPFYWKVVASKDNSYSLATLNLLNAHKSLQFVEYPKADSELFSHFASRVPIFNDYAVFCKLLTQQEQGRTNTVTPYYVGEVVTYSLSDARYIISPQSPIRWFGRTDTNFVMQVQVSDTQQPIAWRFLNRETQNSVDWTFVAPAIK